MVVAGLVFAVTVPAAAQGIDPDPAGTRPAANGPATNGGPTATADEAAPAPATSQPSAARPSATAASRIQRRPPVTTPRPPVPHRTAPAPANNLASRLHTLPATTSQVVIVHATSFTTTYATLQAYQKVDGVWLPAFPAMPARIGSKGFSDNHVEGVPTTPTGRYGFGPTMYGISADPGVRYPYHRLVENDWWDENPASPTYNTFVHRTTSPGGASEALWRIWPAYRHFAVITYNMPDPVPGKGSAIFLHEGTGGPTAGCVSLGSADLVNILTWLDPARMPRIVMAPVHVLDRY